MRIVIHKKDRVYFLAYIFLFILDMIFLIGNYYVENPSMGNIVLIGYIVDITFIFSVIILGRMDDNSFSLNHIILIFFFLFNFGQISLWTLGINSDSELGKQSLYGVYGVPSYKAIYDAEIYAAFCFCCLILGMVISSLLKKKEKVQTNIHIKDEYVKNIIYKVSVIIAIPAIPLTFIKIFFVLMQSWTYGYASLYYSDFSMGVIIGKSEDYFFPAIVGILIGSNYKKVKSVYFIFALYSVFYIISGERGNWLYKLVVLIWMHHRFYKKIKMKTLVRFGLTGMIFLYILGIVVDLRQYGFANVSANQVREAANLNDSFLTRFIFEMGSSLSVIIMVMGFGRETFAQFGNTFITSIIASFSSEISSKFGINHVYLGNYLSENLLHISWGTGFNLFAEFYVNAGYVGAFLVIIPGLIIGFVMQGSSRLNEGRALKSYFACICCSIMCSMVRDSVLGGLRQLVQVALFLYIVILLACKIGLKRKRSTIKI